jgi:hypothetical protein
VSEQAVSEKNRQRVSPFRVYGWSFASNIGSIHDVIMDQTREMNQFQGDREIDMAGTNGACRRSGQERQRRAQPLPAAPDGVTDVPFNGWIECSGLFPDSFFDRVQMWINQLNRMMEFGGGNTSECGPCETFHKLSLVLNVLVVNFESPGSIHFP